MHLHNMSIALVSYFVQVKTLRVARDGLLNMYSPCQNTKAKVIAPNLENLRSLEA